MRNLKSHGLLLAAVAGIIGATIAVAAAADGERSYLPPGAHEKSVTPPHAGNAATHRRKTHVKARHHSHANARHGEESDLSPEEAITFLPRLFLHLFD